MKRAAFFLTFACVSLFMVPVASARYIDPRGTDAVEVHGGRAYWVVEENGYFYNPDVRRVEIGSVQQVGGRQTSRGTRGRFTQIVLNQEFGGGTVRLSAAKTQASRLWREYSDISGWSPADQNRIIQANLNRVAQGNLIQTPSVAASYAAATGRGIGQGGLNTVNGVQDAAIGIVNLAPIIHNHTAGNFVNYLGNQAGFDIDVRSGYIPSPDWSRDLIVPSSDYHHGASKFLGGQGAVTLLTLGASQIGHARHLTHLTTPANANSINASGTLISRGGTFAVSRPWQTPLGRIFQTGTPRTTAAVNLTDEAAAAFRPLEVGYPTGLRAWQRFFGGAYRAEASSISLQTGATTPLSIFNGTTAGTLVDTGLGVGINFASQVQTGTINPFTPDPTFTIYNPAFNHSPTQPTATAAASQPQNNTCFVAGTPVWTESGLRPIESIRPNDRVWSYDPQSQSWALANVVDVHRHHFRGKLVMIRTNGESIGATPNHPLLVLSGRELTRRPIPGELTAGEIDDLGGRGRWVAAEDLLAGDTLLGHGQRSYTAASPVLLPTTVTAVYNIQVEKTHTYAVGSARIVVHNKRIR